MEASNETDESLLIRYGRGDSGAFEALYARHRTPLFRYLSGQCHERSVAEELFQDIWTGIIHASKPYDVRASFPTYLYRIAQDRVDDYLREATTRSESYHPSDQEAGDPRPGEDVDQALLAAARRHAEVEREVVHSPFSRSWLVPASWAAVIALSVSVIALMTWSPELDRALAPGSPALQEIPDARLRPVVQAQDQALPAAAPVARDPAGTAGDAGRLEAARGRPETEPGATGYASPEDWLRAIAELQRQGMSQEAARELAAFERLYPDYPAGEFLRQLRLSMPAEANKSIVPQPGSVE